MWYLGVTRYRERIKKVLNLMKRIILFIIIVGFLLICLNDFCDINILSYAEEYREQENVLALKQELERYKRAQKVELGFRTIDIIFGWNNIFKVAYNLFDSITEMLDEYYLWKPIKYGTLIFLSFVFIGISMNIIMGLSGYDFVDSEKGYIKRDK